MKQAGTGWLLWTSKAQDRIDHNIKGTAYTFQNVPTQPLKAIQFMVTPVVTLAPGVAIVISMIIQATVTNTT